jgi:uncharacterized protein YjbJ (UPF0337 family)
MSKNVIEGRKKEMKGAAAEARGRARGDRMEEFRGKAEKLEGEFQEGYGQARKMIKD